MYLCTHLSLSLKVSLYRHMDLVLHASSNHDHHDHHDETLSCKSSAASKLQERFPSYDMFEPRKVGGPGTPILTPEVCGPVKCCQGFKV